MFQFPVFISYGLRIFYFYFPAYNVHSWTAEDVGQWLENLSLAEYKDSFIRNEIRGMELLHLDKTDIQVNAYHITFSI